MLYSIFIALLLSINAWAAPPAQAAVQTLPKEDTRKVLVVFGDSLSAGYGVPPGQSYPDDLQRTLDAQGYAWRVVNLGISGDTTSGGLARVKQLLLQNSSQSKGGSENMNLMLPLLLLSLQRRYTGELLEGAKARLRIGSNIDDAISAFITPRTGHLEMVIADRQLVGPGIATQAQADVRGIPGLHNIDTAVGNLRRHRDSHIRHSLVQVVLHDPAMSAVAIALERVDIAIRAGPLLQDLLNGRELLPLQAEGADPPVRLEV